MLRKGLTVRSVIRSTYDIITKCAHRKRSGRIFRGVTQSKRGLAMNARDNACKRCLTLVDRLGEQDGIAQGLHGSGM